jgi:hypothetical protein
MKKLHLLFLIMICLTGLHAQSGRADPTYVFPTTPFDKAATRLALEPGDATLRGVAAVKSGVLGKTYPARAGTTVTLFPRTAYFDEWHALRKKHGKSDILAVMSPLAYSHRIVAKVTDDRGSFEFRGLKPGRYYLEASIDFTRQRSQRVQTGTEISASYGNIHINPVYTRYHYLQADRGFVDEFVEIPAGREVVNVKLK